MDLQPPVRLLRRRGKLRIWHVLADEVRRARGVEQLSSNRGFDAPVSAQRDDLVQQVARVARAQRTVQRRVMAPLQVSNHDLMETKVSALAVELEDLHELLERRVVHGDLVGNSAEERLICQRRWV